MRCVVRRQGSALKVTVRTRTSSHEIECAPRERILYAALRAGVGVPYECATGSCGTCKARARPGTVEDVWPQAPGHEYLKRERGEFLMCQGVALGDCEILVPSRMGAEFCAASGPRHVAGTLSEVRSLTHDVDALSVELDGPITFDAGQFVVLAAPGLAGYRAYSMVNEAAETSRLDFIVKRKAGGGFSGWLQAKRAGSTLDVFGPLGKATWRPEEGKNLLCIAGGSGIAGMMSILSHALSSGHFKRHRGDVFFGVRAREDVFFTGERLTGLIDFYFACTDAFAYDLAICLNAWCFEPDGAFNVTKARLMLSNYRKVRPFSAAELEALPLLARGSATRFLLTRLFDLLNHPEGALVRPKDPLEYWRKLRFHQQVSGPAAYGLD